MASDQEQSMILLIKQEDPFNLSMIKIEKSFFFESDELLNEKFQLFTSNKSLEFKYEDMHNCKDETDFDSKLY